MKPEPNQIVGMDLILLFGILIFMLGIVANIYTDSFVPQQAQVIASSTVQK